MKNPIAIFTFLMMLSFAVGAQENIYAFKVNTLQGEPYDLSQLKGKKALIVNTASKCGLTPQYEGLQALWEKYGGDDFVIIGFPANNFMNQEPGSSEEIETFCTENYGVTFPMMEKISVKGDDMNPLYKWLTQKKMNGVEDSEVSWNFQKYLIDEQGHLVKMVEPRTKPDSPEIVGWIEK
ncbi:MAG TPA: glutathione peroxidase [Bacteroidales bacterium]|nr:glutathione peroxidase [Bacteroidales bacterium]